MLGSCYCMIPDSLWIKMILIFFYKNGCAWLFCLIRKLYEVHLKKDYSAKNRSQYNADYPGPRGFLLFFIGKFCDANRSLNKKR